jgi:hypothetical protein
MMFRGVPELREFFSAHFLGSDTMNVDPPETWTFLVSMLVRSLGV